MINITMCIRLATFGFLNFLPMLTTQWSTIVLPEIIQTNLHVMDKTQLSFIAGYFYISFFYGRLLGTFVWPIMVKVVSKKICLLISILIMGVANACSGIGMHMLTICFCRFIAGIALNIHTVGKDFLFEFCDENYRQLGLSIDSSFSLLGGLAGPFIGHYLYYRFDKNFETTCLAIAFLFFIGFILFFHVFFISYTPPLNVSHTDEEMTKMLGHHGQQIESTDVKSVIRKCYQDPSIRGLILMYGISVAATECDLILSVLYLQVDWKNYGLGIDSYVLSKISLLCFIPSCFLLLGSSKFVPKHIKYVNYIRYVLILFTILVFITPLLRDIIPTKSHESYNYIIYAAQSIKYTINPHVFAPYVHYLINKRANKHIRTILNSINFVVSTFIIVISMNIIIPLLSISLYSPLFADYRSYSKDLSFFIVSFLAIISLFILSHSHRGHKH